MFSPEEVKNTLMFKLAQDIFPSIKYGVGIEAISLWYDSNSKSIRVMTHKEFPTFDEKCHRYISKNMTELPSDEFVIKLKTAWNSELADKAIISKSEWEFHCTGKVNGVPIKAVFNKKN